MTPTTNPPTVPAGPRPQAPGRSVLLHGVPWSMYSRLLKVFAERPGVKLAYDRGELEIMSPSLQHDRGGRFLILVVTMLAEELGLPVLPGGSTTMRRRKKLKGVEADEIFWTTHADQLAGVKELDLKVHPPPDLALEIDVSNSSLNRLKIYAALGVPEVWRLDGDSLIFYGLTGKKYAEMPRSRSFPGITPADLLPFIQQSRTAGDQVPVYHAFRAWVRQRAAGQLPPPPAP